MKNEQEYARDISEIRSMMERSTKFLSLTGWSGIMAGIYALIGALAAFTLFGTSGLLHKGLERQEFSMELFSLVMLGILILFLAIGTAVFLSYRKARRNRQTLWNPVARRLVSSMAIPLFTGGILILILLFKGFFGLSAPLTLIFYGLALINAARFSFKELKSLGLSLVVLGLLSCLFLEYSLIFWAIGFGLMHITYGIYMHQKYEN